MLRRLLFAILALCLAAPAMAAPVHCLPPPAITAHHVQTMDGEHAHHHGKAPDTAQKPHDCIGCAMPQLGAGAMREMMPYAAVPAVARDHRLALLGPARPETPPPRT